MACYNEAKKEAGETMKIAITDDEQAMREQLTDYIRRYQAEQGESFQISSFPTADALLGSYRKEYDILIFDIDMPGTNGMDAARILRRAGVASEIIFVTNMAQYAIKGYEVGAIDFVVKPGRYASFALKFRRAVEAARRKRSSRISVDTRDGLRYVDTSDIVFVEVTGHKLIYHTTKGSFESWGTMRAACETLEPFGFALCNACYLVNLSRVVAVSQDMVTVEGGDELKMSRGRKKGFMDALTRPMGD